MMGRDSRGVLKAPPQFLLGDLVGSICLAALLGALALWKAQSIYDACRSAFGDSEPGVLLAEMALASAIFLLPTILMGATFSCLVQAARRADGCAEQKDRQYQGKGVNRVLQHL